MRLLLAALVLASAAWSQASIQILSDATQVLVGRTMAFRAVVRDAQGNPVPNGAGNTVVEIVFADSLRPETVENALTLVDANGVTMAGKTYLLVDFDSQTPVGVGFRPESQLNGNFTAILKGGDAGVQAHDGRTMGGDYQWSFTLTTAHTIFMPLVIQ